MKELTKVKIILIFPETVHFYGNINILVYRSFMRFLYQISCFTTNIRCNDCLFNHECHYFRCTGENFKYYPGILIENDFFCKTIYHKNESVNFTFYLIGDNYRYLEYLKIFFKSYLNQKLAGHYFYLKNINIENIDDELIIISGINTTTLIENNDFIMSYNKMIHYYNNVYKCNFNAIDNINYEIKNIKKMKLEKINLTTKLIRPEGYLMSIRFDKEITLSNLIKHIGIGQFNYIGGGKCEIENNFK